MEQPTPKPAAPAKPKAKPDTMGDAAVAIVAFALVAAITLAVEHWGPPALGWLRAQIHDATKP